MDDIYCIETGCKLGKTPPQPANPLDDGTFFPMDRFRAWRREWEANYGMTQAEINRALCERGRVL